MEWNHIHRFSRRLHVRFRTVINYHETGILSGLRTALIIVLLGGGGIAAILTVGAFSGDRWWVFDLAANFRWQLFWTLLVAAVLYGLTTKGIASLVFLAAAVLNASVIVPLWIGDQPAATGEEGIKVVHADISSNVDSTSFVLRWLFDTEADLILVAGTTAQRMAPLAADGSPYSIIVAPENSYQAGIVALGTEPWPVEEFRTEEYNEPVYRITVGSNGATVSVITTWGGLGSSAEEADKLAARLRTISEVIESSPHPVTVIGNIGATRWTHGMRTLQSSTGVRDATEGSGYAATWPVFDLPVVGGWIGIPINVVLMTSEITPLEITTGPDIGAGHLPLTVVIGPTFGS